MQTHKAMTTSYLVIHPAVVNPVIITVACKPVQACNTCTCTCEWYLVEILQVQARAIQIGYYTTARVTYSSV